MDLVWCSRNPLNNLGVIPGKLAIARATRNPGNQKLLNTAFAGMTVGRSLIYFADFSSRTLDHSLTGSFIFPLSTALPIVTAKRSHGILSSSAQKL